ncbi:MAG: GSU2203 family decaheme c-type cytochrome [Desulfobacteraceae bacterium]|nr:GSU2203 family decaheme c-type cytochrome [Desulfobacteraceae bacterium]
MRHTSSGAKVVQLALLCVLMAFVGACATGAVRERMLTLPTIDGAHNVGDANCAACHEDKMAPFTKTVHGRLASFEVMGGEKGCESCHGPGSLHATEGDSAKIHSFGKLPPDQASALCLKCHSSDALMEWHGNEHALNDVACSDCHRIHQGSQPIKKSLKMPEPDLCYGCHQEYQAKASFPSHHPIKEGKMVCSSCHQPHGSAVKGLKTDERPNDLCYNCHARYQGPFVFEHGPVQEDCGICHDPHGTIANNLLKQSEPFLCLQCHESHFHATRTGSSANPGNTAFDGTALNGSIPAAGSQPTASTRVGFTNTHGSDAWAQAFGTRCTVCHSKVHGSDLPSQTAPSVSPDGTRGWPDGAKGLTR